MITVTPFQVIAFFVSLTIILKSWYDCGSDHKEGKLTYPGEEKDE